MAALEAEDPATREAELPALDRRLLDLTVDQDTFEVLYRRRLHLAFSREPAVRPTASRICNQPRRGTGIAVTGRPETDVTMADLLAQALANPIVGTATTAIGVGAIALWLAAAWWAYADASRRSDANLVALLASGWILLSTPLLLPLSLASYRLARPQLTAADERAQALIRALNDTAAFAAPTCENCHATVDSDWLRCPWCATWLANPCAHCGTWSAAELEACPFCGSEARKARPYAVAGHDKAAPSDVPAAAFVATRQRGPIVPSLRPASYAASRESSSASL